MINMLANDVWSEADIVARGRALIDSEVSPERRMELQTIMLGHIAQMRVATADELAEIAHVQAITELVATGNVKARADMALLQAVLDFEADPTDKVLTPEQQAVYDLRHPVEAL